MKHVVLAALLALSCPLLATAKGSVAAKTAKPAKSVRAAGQDSAQVSAVEAKARAYIRLHKKTHDIFRQLGVLVDDVDDRASADAAAPEAARLVDAFAGVMAEVAALGDPSPEVETALVSYMTSREEEIEAMAQDVLSPMVNLLLDEPACYGSEALEQELSRLLGALRDAAWSEEEELSGCEGEDEDPSAGEATEELEDTESSDDELPPDEEGFDSGEDEDAVGDDEEEEA